MKILYTPKDISSQFEKNIKACKSISLSVAWAGIDFPAFDLLIKNKSKIERGIVGTHFYQTHPNFIEKFIANQKVRFVPYTDGVFHPKLFLFEMKGGSWSSILGSANFTKYAFSKNIEVCMAFNNIDDPDGSLKKTIDSALKDHWCKGKSADQEWLEEYKVFWKKSRERLHALGGYTLNQDIKSKGYNKPPYRVSLLQKSWTNYYQEIRNKDVNDFGKRLVVLKAARDLFATYPNFGEMPESTRGNIAGFEIDPQGPSWKWFGSMSGAGRFMHAVNENSKGLGQALDCIPTLGPVFKEHYMEYIKYYLNAFPRKNSQPIGHGIGTATRLLAMKRPDYFVCLDRANKSGLCKEFDISLNHHEYEKYWDTIIARILDAKWWQSPRPKATQEAQAWDGRAALLDILYYKP